MATSGSTDFSITRDDIIKEALQLCGVLADGESPTADQITSVGRTLNMVAKHWQADGLQLWTRKEGSIALVKDKQSYTCGGTSPDFAERPLKIILAWRRTSTGEDIPLDIISQQEYVDLSLKSSSSVLTSIYYDPQVPQGVIYVWPTDNGSGDTLFFKYNRPIEDFDAATDEPDFPQEWYLPLCYGVAYAIAPKYGVPATTKQDIQQQMVYYKGNVLSYDQEFPSSIQLEPDFRFRKDR